MSKTLHRNLQAKMSALKGPEWDSSDEEEEALSKSSGGRQSKADRKRSKKAQKHADKSSGLKMEDGVSDDEDEDGEKKIVKKYEKPTVLYVGHLPVELEERDLRTFLSQFGNVIHSRISRSLQTGHSRGYGFVQFSDPETAKIVAETLQGYFLGKKRLVCHLIDKPDDGLFFDTDRLIAQRKNDLQVERKRRRENLGNASKMKEITARLVQREMKKRKKLQDLGIDYDFPGYEGSLAAQTDKENSEEPAELSTPKSDKKKKEKKRSNSVSSVGSANSANSSSSATKKSKRKESIGSVGSAGSSSSKSKRKDSIGSVGSNASSVSKKKQKKRRNSEGSGDAAGKKELVKAATTTPTSSSKKKKNKKSRKSL
ncbi:unnamed protein product [Cylindrotheca closterium]|uniref:RRM domain-containing protein n=1 Tax=Cylindrotheca closterium TaxID=2856 RepID=A0AAD2CCG3_9STRA|nr:unnamed protein product [Cylindrotheca closterium]